MAEERVFNILVAEDESFQRLALLDILLCCDYEATAVENGKKALEELKNENNLYDLLLLDLNMPIMDGFELLSIMQEDVRLKEIPVVIMSANDSKEIIANCLQMGAKDYIVKPVRLPDVKALVQNMKAPVLQTSTGETPTFSGLKKFENLRELGKGASGSVSLVRSKEDGNQYAMKTINMKDLQFLTDKDRKNAEAEMLFMELLKGPTLIKSYGHFVDHNCIYLIMEYAEGGSLYELIQRRYMQRKKFEFEEIMSIMAQITLGLMAVHKKQVLHRDIKTQNIFLTKNHTLKIGDFGISKQLTQTVQFGETMIGTPYNMPPEVCEGKTYNFKADVWATGVILYELITFKKPFDSEHLNVLFKKITTGQFDPLPDDTNTTLQLLVNIILNKDYNKRPNIFELARQPCLNKYIMKFITETKCQSEVIDLLPLLENEEPEVDQIISNNSQVAINNNEQNQDQVTDIQQKYMIEQLEQYAVLIRKSIRIQDYKNGWFGKHLRCAQGQDILGWIIEHVEPNVKMATALCQKMLEKDIIQNVNNKLNFIEGEIYRIYMDRDDIADNLVRKWKDEVHQPLEMSINLVHQIEEVYKQAIVEVDDESQIDVEKALNSTQYNGYLIACSELEQANIAKLNNAERIAFFLNIYQCMYIHNFLRMVSEGKGQDLTMFSKFKSYFDYSSKPFFYNICGMNFNLDELKHGVLRGNKKSPSAYLKTLSWNDPRASLIKELSDPRINFVCYDFPDTVELINDFSSEETLDEKLNKFVEEIINDKVEIDLLLKEITLPKLCQTYKDDFGSSDEKILRFVFKYCKLISENEMENIIRDVCVRKCQAIKYE